MNGAGLLRLVSWELKRSRGALATASFGILAGTAALTFFLALGLQARAVLLGQVFPLDRVELEPAARPEPGLLTLLVGGGRTPAGVRQESVDRLAQVSGVVAVYPKLRFAFPSGAFGGTELIGREIGTHEMLAEGIDPALIAKDVQGFAFEDPLEKPGKACTSDEECEGGRYCELPSGAPSGVCSDPVPVVVSPYLVELFNRGLAPAHGLPPVGMTLIQKAKGITFRFQLGASMMGRAKRGTMRNARARVVGISANAMDLGATLPIGVVRRWNQEFYGAEAAVSYSSVVVRVERPDKVAEVIRQASEEGLVPKDNRARDVSVLISGVMGLLSLVAGVMLAVASSSIAYTFRVLVNERRTEIGLYRSLGATPGDMAMWWLTVAVVVGGLGGGLGVVVARGMALGVDWLGHEKLPDFPFKPTTFFQFPWWMVGGAALFGAGFALLGALAGVRRAAAMDPARALLDP
ncbi:MAG: ABC transporter permease [Myxococcales bacterium]|nr:ABC transporter permease [Polyangiaceae bacterium]MDW8248981.1 ABC transporter permease [Myxococcales bacterium]